MKEFDKTFGIKQNVNYFDREGAYIVPVRDGKVGLVKLPKGLFLIGGGIEENETHEECIQRECLEEIGHRVRIIGTIGSAETFATHSKLGFFHPIQFYYKAEILEKVCEPIEKDHDFIWVSYPEIKGKLFSEMQNWALDKAFSD